MWHSQHTGMAELQTCVIVAKFRDKPNNILLVRVRLGAFLFGGARLVCDVCRVERTAAHGLCCATPEGTRCHYDVRGSLFPFG